jgi:hypothetical protein
VVTGVDALPPDVVVTSSATGRVILEDRGGIRFDASPPKGAGSSPGEPSIPVGFGRNPGASHPTRNWRDVSAPGGSFLEQVPWCSGMLAEYGLYAISDDLLELFGSVMVLR